MTPLAAALGKRFDLTRVDPIPLGGIPDHGGAEALWRGLAPVSDGRAMIDLAVDEYSWAADPCTGAWPDVVEFYRAQPRVDSTEASPAYRLIRLTYCCGELYLAAYTTRASAKADAARSTDV